MNDRTRNKESTSLHALHALSIATVAFTLVLFVSSASSGGHSLGNVYSAFNVEGMMKVLPKPNPLRPSESARSCTRTPFAFASPDAERAFMKEKNGSTSDYRFWSRQWGEYWFKDRAYSFDGQRECWDQQLIASKMQEALGDQPTGALTFSQVSRFAAAVDKELQRRRIDPDSVVTQTQLSVEPKFRGDDKHQTRTAVDSDDPIYQAAGRGDTSQVKKLIASGAPVNLIHSNGWTPLMRASAQGHRDVVRALLVGGANVNYKDNNRGSSALSLASLMGHLQVVQTLLDNGADVNIKNEHGVTPLMFASLEGHREVVQALLANGANVNAETYNGETALMGASEKGHRNVVQTLRRAGAR